MNMFGQCCGGQSIEGVSFHIENESIDKNTYFAREFVETSIRQHCI